MELPANNLQFNVTTVTRNLAIMNISRVSIRQFLGIEPQVALVIVHAAAAIVLTGRTAVTFPTTVSSSLGVQMAASYESRTAGSQTREQAMYIHTCRYSSRSTTTNTCL